MRLLTAITGACLILASATACDLDTHLARSQPAPACVKPTLTVVGARHGAGRLTVHPGETLHLRGTHYTDDCAAGGQGAGTLIPELQLILRSRHRIGPVATVHPHGPDAAFTTSVTVPATTFPGPAALMDVLGPPHGVIRLVVRH